MENNVLITGSNGFIGGKLVKLFLEMTDYDIVAVGSRVDKIKLMLQREGIEDGRRVHPIKNDYFLDSSSEMTIDNAVHLAFSRRNRPASEIADSIRFSSAVFQRLAEVGTKRVINVSSQGVYGNTEDFRTEDTPPAPVTAYTMAKYATEVIFEDIFSSNDAIDHTSLRLDPVAQTQNVMLALCAQAKKGQINLRGGNQVFSFIDVDDAARAIIAMLNSDTGWERAYNVGWNRRRYTLTELAERIADRAEKLGFGRPDITLERQDISLWAGMDSSLFAAHAKWEPQHDLDAMIDSIIMAS